MISKSALKRYKAGAVLVDLTAAYDTVWHQGLILKLLRTIPDRHLVRFIATCILANRSFILKTNDGQASRPRRLRNGVPQSSVLAPFCLACTKATCRVQLHHSMATLMTLPSTTRINAGEKSRTHWRRT